jgi:hypothetical protein
MRAVKERQADRTVTLLFFSPTIFTLPLCHSATRLHSLLRSSFSILTRQSPLIQQSVTQSKWNMGEICGLKLFIYDVYIHHNFIFEIPPYAKKVIFITEFAI